MPELTFVDTVLCEMIGEQIKRLAKLIEEPIKLTGKRALHKALVEVRPDSLAAVCRTRFKGLALK
jgi:hypothetical protein